MAKTTSLSVMALVAESPTSRACASMPVTSASTMVAATSGVECDGKPGVAHGRDGVAINVRPPSNACGRGTGRGFQHETAVQHPAVLGDTYMRMTPEMTLCTGFA
eukprot:GO255405.1.p2 GENE.GO255405.1~~GO255405.1.p2  ORF type:complete len:105 (-),score=9.40 GO255405.1:72-386(-)